jgi:hypothetical protein
MDDITGPHRYRRNHIWQCLPWQATRRCDLQHQIEKRKEQHTDNHDSRRQHELPTQRHHRHSKRWSRITSGPGLHQRIARPILYRPGHVEVGGKQLSKRGAMLTSSQQKCAHVQSKKRAWKRCWFGQRSRYCQQSQRPKRWTPWINGSDKHLVLIMNT